MIVDWLLKPSVVAYYCLSASPPPFSCHLLTSAPLPSSSSGGIGKIFSCISTLPLLTPFPSLTLTQSTLNLEPPRSRARNCPFSAAKVDTHPVHSVCWLNIQKQGEKKRCLFEPDPSGVDRTCVGSILTTAAALLSADRPFFISARKRLEMSLSCSSPRRIACRNLSTWNKGPSVWV